MNKEDFLASLTVPIDDYRALRRMESGSVQTNNQSAAPKPIAEQPKKSLDWSNLSEEGQLAVDVYETTDHVVISASVAGVKPDEVDVTVSGDMVTVRGKRHQEEAQHERTYYYRECFFGSFSRTIVLPVHIVADRAEATIKNGFLTVKIPKATNQTKVPITETE